MGNEPERRHFDAREEFVAKSGCKRIARVRFLSVAKHAAITSKTHGAFFKAPEQTPVGQVCPRMTNAANLIYDLGAHNGQDSDFYLKKGFNVVAVEANPALCDSLRRRFSREIAEGRFSLVEKAVGERFGKVEFFVNTDRSVWGTTAYNQRYRERSSAKVSPNWTKIVVPSVPFSWLTDQFGVPYYLKIDIEGADLLCLEDLLRTEDQPNFISIERQPFLADQLKELGLLKALGYTRFKVIDQKAVMRQRPPKLAQEGVYVDHRFEFDATGLFGEESPGPWLSYGGAIARNAAIAAQSKAFGLWRRTPGLNRLRSSWGSWYDFHAALPRTDETGVETGDDEIDEVPASRSEADQNA